MNRICEKDFIRLLKINKQAHSLLRQERMLWSLLYDELAGDYETSKAFVNETIESDLYNFLDMSEDNVINSENATSKICIKLYKILDRITGKENSTIKDYYEAKKAKY